MKHVTVTMNGIYLLFFLSQWKQTGVIWYKSKKSVINSLYFGIFGKSFSDNGGKKDCSNWNAIVVFYVNAIIPENTVESEIISETTKVMKHFASKFQVY